MKKIKEKYLFFSVLVVAAAAIIIFPSLFSSDRIGQAITKLISCSDSDGGMDIYIKGITAKGLKKIEDSCASDSSVLEGYCSSGKISSTELACDRYCHSGACVIPPP